MTFKSSQIISNRLDIQITSLQQVVMQKCLSYLIAFLINSFQNLHQEITAGPNATCFSMVLLSKIRLLSSSYIFHN